MLVGPSKRARLSARLRRSALDRALAAGADPAASPTVAVRAAQLGAPSPRARSAAGLESIALAASADRGPARIQPSRPAVRANRERLLDLAALLRRSGPLYAQGVAMLELVLIDGCGPAYTDRRGEALTRELELARLSLCGAGWGS